MHALLACTHFEKVMTMSIRFLKMLLLALAAAFALATGAAAAEPSIQQIYDAAQAGRLEQAQQMIRQVLADHPSSGKAHYVAAELNARQGNMGAAREELANAERLAPGLPFAKPEAVQALRSQLAAKAVVGSSVNPVKPQVYSTPANASTSFPWGWVLLLAGGGVLLYMLTRRRMQQPVYAAPAAYGGGGGMAPAGGGYPVGPTYGPAPMGGGGVGSGIMGGLATGLAVGAGVVAAEQIGRHMFGGDNHSGSSAASAAGNDYIPIDPNPNMGGNNFGIQDTGSWDDGGSGGGAGGGDWDT